VCSTATAASACSRSTSRRGTQVRNAIDRGPHVDAAAPEVPERSPTTIGQGDDHEFDDPGDAARPKAGGPVYPVRAHAGRDGPLSRRLWLVKWLLILPHVLVLIPLWIGFLLLSLVAAGRDRRHRPLPAVALRLQRRRAALDLAGGPTGTRPSGWTSAVTIPVSPRSRTEIPTRTPG
jgi:hypothetical protein